MKVEFSYQGIPFVVTGKFIPGSPDSYYVQGDSPEFEIESVMLYGVALNQDEVDHLFEDDRWYTLLVCVAEGIYLSELVEMFDSLHE